MELEPVLHVRLTERARLEELLSAPIEKVLAPILADLGIPGKPEVLIRASVLARPLRVFVHENLVPYSQAMARTVWEYFSSTDLGSLPLMFSFSNWVKENIAREKLNTDSQHLGAVSELLVHLVVQIVKKNPENLFLREQAIAFIERARQDLPKGIKDRTDTLHVVLTALLRLGISVADRRAIARRIPDGWDKRLDEECSIETLTETLVSLLRSDAVRVDINPDHFRQLIGVELNRPISAYDPSFGVKASKIFRWVTERIFSEMGLRVPDILFVPDKRIRGTGFAVRMNDCVGVPRKGLGPHQLLAEATKSGLQVSALPTIHPVGNNECAVIGKEDEENLPEQIQTWDAFGYIALALSAEIRRNADRLLDREVVEFELGQLHPAFELSHPYQTMAPAGEGRCACASSPFLVLGALEKLPAAKLTQVLRLLLAEEISIRNLRTILERVSNFDSIVVKSAKHTVFDCRLAIPEPLEAPRHPWGVELYAQHVRKGLQAYIRYKYACGGAPAVYELCPEVQQRLLEHVASERLAQRRFLLTSDERERIRAAVRTAHPGDPGATGLVILTVSATRFCLHKLLKDEFPDLGVLDYDEFVAVGQRKPISRICW